MYINNEAKTIDVAEPITSKYYSATIISDYTYVTGVEQKRTPYYGENGGVVYVYNDTKAGEYNEVVDYMSYLREDGWSDYDTEKDGDSITWYFAKDYTLIGVAYYSEFDEIWIMLGS